MPDVMIARKGARLSVGGRDVRILANGTTAHAGSDVVRDHPELWEPLTVDFPAEAETPGAPLAPGVAPVRPAAREGRAAWDAHAVALGLNPEAVAAVASKADVIALVDAIEAGTARVGADGTVEEA